MKNFKFIVAVAAITFATFGSISTSTAKAVDGGEGRCDSSNDTCGTSNFGNVICGTYHRN